MRNRWGLLVLSLSLIIPLVMMMVLPTGLVGDGVDEEGAWVPVSGPEEDAKIGKGGPYYAEVEYRDDMYHPALFETRVNITPGGWPGFTATAHPRMEDVIILIQIRGVTAPDFNVSRSQPHHEIRRERQRFDEAMTYMWKMLSASEHFLLENPVMLSVGGTDYFNEVFVCDAYFELGKQKVSIAEMIVESGHGKWGESDSFDWGSRSIMSISR